MTEEERELINRMKDYIAGAMPDPRDTEFWNDRERVKEHLTWVMYRKTRFEKPSIDVEVNEETGEATVTVDLFVNRMIIDLDMERCPCCHAEMEFGTIVLERWWCPECNYELKVENEKKS